MACYGNIHLSLQSSYLEHKTTKLGVKSSNLYGAPFPHVYSMIEGSFLSRGRRGIRYCACISASLGIMRIAFSR